MTRDFAARFALTRLSGPILFRKTANTIRTIRLRLRIAEPNRDIAVLYSAPWFVLSFAQTLKSASNERYYPDTLALYLRITIRNAA